MPDRWRTMEQTRVSVCKKFSCNTVLRLTPKATSAAAAGRRTKDSDVVPSPDDSLLPLVRLGMTEQAWAEYSKVITGGVSSSTCLSRLVSQLSYPATPAAVSRTRTVVRRLADKDQLSFLDANALDLLAAAAARSGAAPFAVSFLRFMLWSGQLPNFKAWSAVASRLTAVETLRVFDAVVRRARSLPSAAAADAAPDTAAYNAALNACASVGNVARFAQLFDEMPQYDLAPDVLSFNVMIKLCARVGRKDLLVRVLERILLAGITPCRTTFHSLVAAYVGFGDIDTAEQLVQAMREQRLDICLVLISANEQDSRLNNQNGDVLDRLLGKSDCPPPLLPRAYAPDSRIYTTLMKGYMKMGRVGDVVQMLEAMRQEEDIASRPDHVTYTTVVSALVQAGNVDRARLVLSEMARDGVPANRITYNVLLKGYCQQLQMGQARELVREMSEVAGFKLDVVSYNTLIDGCIMVDDSASALKYFNEMRGKGIAPSTVSYTTLMKAFASAGQPKLVRRVFDEMVKDPRVKPDLVAWNMLVEGYSKLGLVEEAKKAVEQMKENGLYPDVSTYGSLANAIALARKPGEALLLWNEIKNRWKPQDQQDGSSSMPPIKPDEGLLGTLADICVRAASFQKALEIVACMEENGISPNKTKYKRIYVEMHSKMFTSKHASQARRDRRSERKRAAEAFKFWLGLPNSYYGSEWRLEPAADDYAAGF